MREEKAPHASHASSATQPSGLEACRIRCAPRGIPVRCICGVPSASSPLELLMPVVQHLQMMHHEDTTHAGCVHQPAFASSFRGCVPPPFPPPPPTYATTCRAGARRPPANSPSEQQRGDGTPSPKQHRGPHGLHAYAGGALIWRAAHKLFSARQAAQAPARRTTCSVAGRAWPARAQLQAAAWGTAPARAATPGTASQHAGLPMERMAAPAWLLVRLWHRAAMLLRCRQAAGTARVAPYCSAACGVMGLRPHQHATAQAHGRGQGSTSARQQASSAPLQRQRR